jgi:hypothetical protein
MPDATGYAVGAVHVDAEDPQLRSRQLSRAFHPPGESTRLIEGLDAVYDQCGNAWCALSWSLVEREAWLRAAREHRDLALAHPIFPQVVIFAAMAAERPRWGWLAEPLIRQRNATTFLFEQGEVPLADRWSEIIGGVAAAWGAVLGRGGARWRRRMRLLHRVWGGAGDMRATKLYDEPTLRSQARLSLVCLRAFWPARGYWRDVLAPTLMPAWLTRARYAAEGRWPAGARGSQLRQITLSASLPTSLSAESVARVDVVVCNDGRRSVHAAGPNAVTIGQHWSIVEGRALEPEELALNALAAMPQSLPHAIRADRSVLVELALFAPLEPGLYRAEVIAHRHGRGWLDGAGESQVLADVEVVHREME